MWHHYAGDALIIHSISPCGEYSKYVLNQDEHFQQLIPAGHWFAAEPASDASYALVGCTVTPGFLFDTFEMATKSTLSKEYRVHQQLINRLCRS